MIELPSGDVVSGRITRISPVEQFDHQPFDWFFSVWVRGQEIEQFFPTEAEARSARSSLVKVCFPS